MVLDKSSKIFLITSGVFIAEALIHYNLGKNGDDEKFKFKIPPFDESWKLISVVITFSFINSLFIKNIK
jgi:hypothetical protein